ncbi:hypothetical protein D3C81_1465410 [compost metagenome]
MVALKTFQIGQIAQPASADHSGHGGVAHQCYQGDGNSGNQRRGRLRQQHAENNGAGFGSHGTCCLYDSLVHLAQANFNQPGVEGRGADNQRRQRGIGPQNGADQRLGERDQQHDQNNEGDGAEYVDQH